MVWCKKCIFGAKNINTYKHSQFGNLAGFKINFSAIIINYNKNLEANKKKKKAPVRLVIYWKCKRPRIRLCRRASRRCSSSARASRRLLSKPKQPALSRNRTRLSMSRKTCTQPWRTAVRSGQRRLSSHSSTTSNKSEAVRRPKRRTSRGAEATRSFLASCTR